MAYVISDDCISCGTCEGECQQALSAKVMESTLSMQIHAWIAVLVQAFAQQVLSARNNSLRLTKCKEDIVNAVSFLFILIQESLI